LSNKKLWKTKTGPDGRAILSRSGKPVHYQTEVGKEALPKGGLTIVSPPINVPEEERKEEEPTITSGNVDTNQVREIISHIKANYRSWKQEVAMMNVRECLMKIESGSPIQRVMAENKLRRKYPQVYKIYKKVEDE
jgi:hypothetical protein